jgi:hypothetical protein
MHSFFADVNWPAVVTLFAWLKEWQFLVGVLIAAFASVIVVKAINNQSQQQRLEIEERRGRLARAFRASMPEDLHAICSYAHRSADVVREGLLVISAEEEGQRTVSPRGKSNRLRCPIVPSYVLGNLKALVEHLEPSSAEQVADLLGCYYTQHIRLTGALGNFDRSNASAITVSRSVNFNPVFKDTLELYLRAKAMVDFARRETEEISTKFSASDVLHALRELNIDQVVSPEAREHCIRFLSAQVRR